MHQSIHPSPRPCVLGGIGLRQISPPAPSTTVTNTHDHIDRPASTHPFIHPSTHPSIPHLAHAVLDALGLRQTPPGLGKAHLQLHVPFPDGPRPLWWHPVRVQRALEQHSKVLLVVALACSDGGVGGGSAYLTTKSHQHHHLSIHSHYGGHS